MNISIAIKPVKNTKDRLIFDPMLLVNSGMNNIRITEDFAFVVIWDPLGTKVHYSALVALPSDGESVLSH